jgi:putative colanic acid biosynthesis acetyltransferase WcaB
MWPRVRPEKMNGILQDWKANHGNPKGRFVMVFFRVCQAIRRSPLWPLGLPVLAVYVLLVHWLMGIELDYQTEVGPGLSLQHGTGLVVHQKARIGSGCTLRHGVTLGERVKNGPLPVLGNGVEIGANAVLLGGIVVGDRSVVGAGSVVLQDVPPCSVVAGNPAKILRTIA